MAKLGGTVEEGEPRSGRGRHLRDAIKPGRWIVLLLGILATLVLSGYLITDHLATPTAATDKSSFSSMTDILKAALGAAVALAWAVFGAWLGRRRARRPKYLDEPADDMRATDYPSRTPYDSGRAPTCERMYDETRLVPQYLRSAKFPAMKKDLVRLAREHIDEGQALRRLECIPDRCYCSLHDLITEICID